MSDFGWNVNEEAWDQEITPSVDVSIDPEQQFVSALVNKDIELLKKILTILPHAPKQVGKEKTSVFFMRHFDEAIAELLVKNKISFKDSQKIFDAIFSNDDAGAFKWYLQQKHNKDQMTDVQFLDGMFNQVNSNGCVQCLYHLEDLGLDFKKHSKTQDYRNVSMNKNLSNIFIAAIKTHQTRALDYFETQAFYNSDYKNEWHRLLSDHSLNYANYKFLDVYLKDNAHLQKSFKKTFPLEESLHFSTYNGLRHPWMELVDKKYIKTEQSWQRGDVPITYSNVLEYVFAKALPVVEEISKTPSGARAIAKIIDEKPKMVLSFARNVSVMNVDDMMRMIKILGDKGKVWKDPNNHNFAHLIFFCRQSRDISKSLLEKMHSYNPQWFLEESDKGLSCVAFCEDQKLLAVFEKKVMTSQIKNAGIKGATVVKHRKM